MRLLIKRWLFILMFITPGPGMLIEPSTAISDEKDVLGIHQITFDTAHVSMISNLQYDAEVWAQTSECFECEFLFIVDLPASFSIDFYADTRYPMLLQIRSSSTDFSNTTNSLLKYHFGENGGYNVSVENVENQLTLTVDVINKPEFSATPIFVAIGIYAGLACLYILLKQAIRREWISKICCCCASYSLNNNDLGSTSEGPSDTQSINKEKKTNSKKRLKSLDTFRGFSLVVMIFVNYGGGRYWYFEHSIWNGLTVADLVFPWFIFIMGTSIILSQHSLRSKGVTRWELFKKILRRTVILFLLGLFLNTAGGHNDLQYIRIPGVLQRFSISYFFVATLELFFGKTPKVKGIVLQNRWYGYVFDVFDYWVEWLVIMALVVTHTCLTFLLPVPGCPTAYLGPGGTMIYGINNTVSMCTGGAAGYIDKWFFGEDHIYQYPTCQVIYGTGAYDPEGMLGSINSIFMTFLGLQAGKIVLLYPGDRQRIIRLVIWGIITGVIGTILCKASKEDGWIPVNKNLWSLSYVFALAGMAFILLALFYYVIDVAHWYSGNPFFYPGMNSILIYVCHEVFYSYFPLSWAPYKGNHAEYLAMSLLGVSIWVIVAYYFYTIKFFLKI
ncbi:heparan-alpha-glucosaminide N-acetyltransferase-like isoform X2 [Anneissia japonica]|uniref:heparan-alpha-glucosaminide N-acetyltransferase-like isoform X2 n=1 Tax=Anneissia japonica TaxID=1529436 RepID=UPI0014256A38|nr:heparan-alpha-glucosaminide N-acetyltransferase-like isoform X2 [Anneissia japonica]